MEQKQKQICALIPTYNNASTLADVIQRTSQYLTDIVVVVDGATDNTREILQAFPQVHVIDYAQNRGKGYALRKGLEYVKEQGYEYALTLDSDGQHYPEDIPAMLEALRYQPGSLIIGSRGTKHDNMPGANTFANRFSNFWFMVQTWLPLPDTQTGMRIYPVQKLRGLRFLTSRYEAELELLVFSAWANIRIVPVPIHVYYPPKEERVSHFKPVLDFTRISILNTILCIIAVVYGLPRRMTYNLIFAFRLILWTSILGTGYGLILQLLGLLCIDKVYLHYRRFVKWTAHHIVGHIPYAPLTIPDKCEQDKPCLYIANHCSMLDVLMLLSLDEKVIILTKGYVMNNPVFGMFARLVGFVSVSNGYEDNVKKLRKWIDKGYSIIVFPEGTRTGTGKIGRFHRGAFYLAEQLQLPIQPMLITGTFRVADKNEFHLYAGKMELEYLPQMKDDTEGKMDYRKKTIAYENYYKTIWNKKNPAIV